MTAAASPMLLLLALSLSPTIADDGQPAPSPLPESWHGTYAGTFTVESDVPSEVGAFPGELRIAPVDGSPAVSWTVIYGEDEHRQVRPYELVPVPEAPGRFVIDEKNGVTIDMKLVGDDLLLGQFVVGDSLIVARYERSDDAIRCELATFDASPSRTMSIEGVDFTVATAPLRSIQRAELRRLPDTGPVPADPR